MATQGQAAEGVFIVKKGWVRTVIRARSDRHVTVGLHGPGAVLALPETITADRNTSSIETVDDSEIEFLPARHLRTLLEQERALAGHLLQIVSVQALKAMEDVHEGTDASMAERLLKILRDLSVQCGRETADGVRMRLPFTVQHLADRIGCSRQWATKTLSELEARRLVLRKGGWITVSHADDGHKEPKGTRKPRQRDKSRNPSFR